MIGRIDVVPEVIDIAMYILHRDFPPNSVDLVTHHPKPFIRGATHLLLSRKNPDAERHLKIFNKGMAQMKASGRFEKVLLESRQGLYAPQ